MESSIRLGTRLGYALCIAVWSGAAMLHAAATGPLFLAATRFLLGIGEAGNWPAGVKVVAEWFPERERALASGIFNSGSSSSRYPGFRRSWPGLSCIPAGAPLSCWWG